MPEDDTLLDRCYVKRFIIDCRASDGGSGGRRFKSSNPDFEAKVPRGSCSD